MAYDNTNRGTIGENTRRQNDKQPDMTGQLNVNGVGYWLSGWKKQSATGEFISLEVKPKDKPVSAHSAAKADGYVKQPDKSLADDGDFLADSDIPF